MDTLYEERAPSDALRDVLACTWTRVTPFGQQFTVVPDACMDIIWGADGRLSVAGPDTMPFRVQGAGERRVVGLRFLPGVAPAFLGVPACELRNQHVDLADLWGGACADALVEKIARAPDAAEELLSRAVEERARTAAMPGFFSPRVVRLLGRGQRSVRSVAGELGLSERQLLRRCESAFGYGPKTLQRILRFQRALSVSRGRQVPLPLALLAVSTGYADQAHLAREFTQLAGCPPKRLLRAGAKT